MTPDLFDDLGDFFRDYIVEPFRKAGEIITYPGRAIGILPPGPGAELVGIPAAIEYVKEKVDTVEQTIADFTKGASARYDALAEFFARQIEDAKTAAGEIVTPVSDFVKAITDAVGKFEMPKMPEIKMPEIKMPEITMPEIKMPDIGIVMPEIKMPTIAMPEMKIPETLPLAAAAIGITALLIFGGVI